MISPPNTFLSGGNFNAYVTSDNRLKSYADGIVTYVFNNKTKKLKSINVEQYRIFKMQDEMNGSFLSYTAGLDIQRLKYVGKPDEYKPEKIRLKN